MAKKKKDKKNEEDILIKSNAKREVKKFKPTEWAIQKGIDPTLFLYWENQLMDEQEFEKIKKKVI